VFGSTIYSFSAMLSVFLFGLALGSIAGGWLADKVRHPARLLAWTQGGVALAALCGGLAVNAMPSVFLRTLARFGHDFDGMTATKLLLSSLVLLPAAVLFGATFPVVVKLAPAAGRGTGSRIGRVYVLNTVGAILGSFLAGFVLLPSIGMERTLVLVIVVAAALAIGSLAADPGRRARTAIPAAVAIAAVVAAALAGPGWNRGLLGAGVYFDPQQFVDAAGRPALDNVLSDYELMTYTEGYNETIISYRSPKGRFITVNGSPTASDHFDDMFAQRMLGHLPMALCPARAKSACIVGLGAGVTAGSIAIYDLDRLTALEIETGVFVASRLFEEQNHHLLDNPKLAVLIDDGRNFLKVTDEKFDVISSAPNFPSLTGSGALFSTEFFELARARLAPGGVVCHYAPIFRIQPADVAAILGSFKDVFPHVRVFSTGLWIIVLGRMEPFPPVDVPELSRRVSDPKVAASLAEIGVRGPIELLSFYQFDEDGLSAIVDGAARNTDDQPRAEFDVPRSLFSSTVSANLEMLRAHRATREERAEKLGLSGEDRSSYIALAAAYDDATSGQIDLLAGRTEAGLAELLPVAESGSRFARVVAADYFVRRGLKMQHDGASADARRSFESALRYEPDRVEALVGVGYLDIFDGNTAEADRLLTRAVELYPRSAGAVYRLGVVRQVQGRNAEAEELYRRAIARAPRLGPARGLLGSLLLARGDAAGALEQFEIAIACGEHSAGVVEGREAALTALGRAGSR
jgi:spermidine synthase